MDKKQVADLMRKNGKHMVTMEKNGQRKEVAPDKLALFTRQGWTQVADTEPETGEAAELMKAAKRAVKKGKAELADLNEANTFISARQQVYGSGVNLPTDKYTEDETYSATVTGFYNRASNNAAGVSTVCEAETETGEKVTIYPPSGGQFTADIGEVVEFIATNVSRTEKTALLAIAV